MGHKKITYKQVQTEIHNHRYDTAMLLGSLHTIIMKTSHAKTELAIASLNNASTRVVAECKKLDEIMNTKGTRVVTPQEELSYQTKTNALFTALTGIVQALVDDVSVILEVPVTMNELKEGL